MENLKPRIAVLWIWMAVAISAHSLLFLFEPGAMEKLDSEEMRMGAGMLLFNAIFWLVPLVMAFLSLTLCDKACRWSNMILGGIFTILNIFHLVMAVSYFGAAVHQILVVGSTVVATGLVFFYALRWPKEPEKAA